MEEHPPMQLHHPASSPWLKAAGATVWLWLSILAALLAVAGSVVGLADGRIYARLTPVFLPQALAQDVANLVIASPALLVLAALALRGSLRAYLLWLGVLTFTVYNYVIYTFSIPFGPLFLLWVAVLGLSFFTLLGGVAAVDHAAVAARFRFASRRAVQVVAWALIVVSTPQSVVDVALPTNPVHVLDLAFFLPGVIAIGVSLLKRMPLAYILAPPSLVLLILTGIPILLTPAVQTVRGETAAWSVAVPIGLLTVLLLGLLAWLLSTLRFDG
jgi:hypothetical protein